MRCCARSVPPRAVVGVCCVVCVLFLDGASAGAISAISAEVLMRDLQQSGRIGVGRGASRGRNPPTHRASLWAALPDMQPGGCDRGRRELARRGPARPHMMEQTRRPWVACPPSALFAPPTIHIGSTLPTGLPCGSAGCDASERLSPPRCTTHTADPHPMNVVQIPQTFHADLAASRRHHCIGRPRVRRMDGRCGGVVEGVARNVEMPWVSVDRSTRYTTERRSCRSRRQRLSSSSSSR
jgi:hypothetical protein